MKKSPLDRLEKMDPWDWPEDTDRTVLGILQNPGTSRSDLMRAMVIAGDEVVVNDEIVALFLRMLAGDDTPPDVRARAAHSLGVAMESADIDLEDAPISVKTFESAKEVLHRVYHDERTPDDVRRAALESAVRAAGAWQAAAVREAYRRDDLPWKRTAVFCMQFLRGFDAEILESLGHPNWEIQRWAVVAAGTWEIRAAWPHVRALLRPETRKELLLDAIEASAQVHPSDAGAALADLLECGDEEIVEAADEAMMEAEMAAENPEGEGR